MQRKNYDGDKKKHRSIYKDGAKARWVARLGNARPVVYLLLASFPSTLLVYSAAPTSSPAASGRGCLVDDPALLLVLAPAAGHRPTAGARARRGSGKP